MSALFCDSETLEHVQQELHVNAGALRERERVTCALALARQKRIGEANRRIQRGFIDGIGEVVASIDADIYHRLAAIYGYETLRDPHFLHSLLRDNPDLRVKTVSRKSGIVVPETVRGIEDVDTTPAEIEAGDFPHHEPKAAPLEDAA